MSDEALREISSKLDTIIALLGISLAPDEPKKDRIVLMAAAGMRPKEIAVLLDTTPGAVSVVISQSKAASSKKKTKH